MQKTGNQASKDKSEATELMKRVAMAGGGAKRFQKSLSEADAKEVERRVQEKVMTEAEERKIDRIKYRQIKRRVKEMEAGNNSRLILFPSVGQGGWYKMIEFSALYYAYRLADRMGRKVNVRNDNDAHSKAMYSASLQNVEKFKQQFKEIETDEIEVCEDGVIICNLKKPLTEDEVGQLRKVEETRRDRAHNILKPKAMNPTVYQSILLLTRQMLPRVRKLDKMNYSVIGNYLARELVEFLMVYFCYADGLIDKKTAGSRLIAAANKMLAEVSMLAETRVWNYDVAAVIGENVNGLKQITLKEFKLTKEE